MMSVFEELREYPLQNHLRKCEGAASKRIMRPNSLSTYETRQVFKAKTNTYRERRVIRNIYRVLSTLELHKRLTVQGQSMSTDSPVIQIGNH